MKRHPVERIVRWLSCKVRGHAYFITRRFGYGERKIACARCAECWAMDDKTKSLLPWDDDFEAMYSPGGSLATEGPDSNRGESKGEVATRHDPAQDMAQGRSADGVTIQRLREENTRLLRICTIAHDEILSGTPDKELLDILSASWQHMPPNT